MRARTWQRIVLSVAVAVAVVGPLAAQGFGSDPVFSVAVHPDREPLVAGAGPNPP